MADTLIYMVMALVVFGPRRLPQIGRQIGKLMYEFRKASNDFKFQMEEELRNAEEADRRKKEEEERQRQLAANPPAQIEASVTPAAETPATENASPYGSYSEAAEAQAKAEATYPSIRPPATGEPVAAVWPENEVLSSGAGTSSEDTSSPDAVAEEPAIENDHTAIETAKDLNKTNEPAVPNG
jgi:sec-independent protein translocase protein TatB